MIITVLNLLSNLWKPLPKQVTARTHLILAGINQMVFLKQWGEPETQIGLNPLGRLNKLGSLFLITEPTEKVPHSVWIYKKRDSILFFNRKRLVSHFRWKEFR